MLQPPTPRSSISIISNYLRSLLEKSYGWSARCAIRLIGPDCFSKLNKEGHDEALDELVRRKKRERDNSFLLGRREQHLSTLAALKATNQVGLALDQFGVALRKTLVEKQNIDIWRHVKSGTLEVVEKFREAVSNRNNPLLWRGNSRSRCRTS
jgi:hypothetical protein